MTNIQSGSRNLLRRRTDELQVLVRIAQLVNVLDLDSVLSQTLELAVKVIDARKGSFFLLDHKGYPIQRFITQRNMPPEVSREVARDVIRKGLAGWCVRHQVGAVVSDISQDSRWHTFPDDSQQDIRSALCVPVLFERQVQGIMTLVSPEVGHFDSSHLELIEAIANQASTAIRNARLYDFSQIQQHHLELVVQNTGEAVLTVDSDLTITLANHEALELLGQPPDAIIQGQNLLEVGESTVFASIIETLQESGLQSGTHSFELTDEENRRDFVVNVSALARDSLTFKRTYVIAVHDVTSIKELSRLQSHIMQIMTHDLKNPLNIIWGYVDLIGKDGEKGLPPNQAFVDGTLRALQRMDDLIDEALSADKGMASDTPISRHYFDPEEAIRESVEEIRQLAETKRQQIEVDIDNSGGNIWGLRFQIREAAVNLLSNALKYTPNGGTIKVKAYDEDGRFHFSVEDSGLGIPKNMQGELFKRFYRATRPETAGIAGTGLGLNLVKEAVEFHQGQVWFKSEEGVGSVFGFWIPILTEDSDDEDSTHAS